MIPGRPKHYQNWWSRAIIPSPPVLPTGRVAWLSSWDARSRAGLRVISRQDDPLVISHGKLENHNFIVLNGKSSCL